MVKDYFKMFLEKKSGFSLVELVVIVTIAAILASAIISVVGSSKVKGRDVRRVADINFIAQKINSYFIEKKDYPPDYQSLTSWLNQTLPVDPQTSNDYMYDCVVINAGSCAQYRLKALLESSSQSNYAEKDNTDACVLRFFAIENSVSGAIEPVVNNKACTP